MPDLTTRALHDRWLASLAAQPGRGAFRALPGGVLCDVDAFERQVMGFDRRLLRLCRGDGGESAPLEIDAGQIVLLSSRNLPAWPVAVAALWKRGFVPLPADPDLGRAEIQMLVEQFRPVLCLFDRRVEPPGGRFDDLNDALPGLRAWRPPRRTRPAIAPGTAVIRLTSGTTGRPRGIAVTPEQLVADTRQITAALGIGPKDTMVAAVPLGHAYGFGHILMAMVLHGTRLILLEQPLPALLLETLAGPGPIALSGTPYLFDLLLKAAEHRRFKGLRLCVSSGAPLPGGLSTQFRKALGVPIRTFYGASECGGIACDRSPAGTLDDGCVGTPLEEVGVDIVPEAGLDPGCGRIRVASAAVSAGYLERDHIIPFPGRPGTYVTPDLGRIDDAGRLWITGRADRIINVDGRKVHPAEIEALLRGIPKVHQAVVFGVPDRRRGHAVCACIVADRGVTREAVLAACTARLAPFKVPRRVEFVASIPVTARGKTDRAALAALAGVAERPVTAPPAGGPAGVRNRPRRTHARA